MIDKGRVLAVIPARGGSKRCVGKNLKLFRGKSLIEWALEAARGSKYIDRIVVSSDNVEIQLHAGRLGAEVIDRPWRLGIDTAAVEDVLRHALSLNPDHQWVVLLQPTSPLRTFQDIDHTLEGMIQNGTEVGISRRQNPLSPHGFKNGAVYVMSAHLLERGHNFDTNRVKSWYHMPDERSLDIDYEWQFHV